MKPHPALLPVSWLYAAVVAVRNLLFDMGMCRVRKAPAPVVCVGNITAGGTGKTPFVIHFCRRLKAEGIRCAVVSRGYGRHSRGPVVVSDGRTVCAGVRQGGDEPVVMARSLPGVPVVVDEDRGRGAATAVERFGAELIVLDDGFQHRRLFRDQDVVLVPAEHAARSPHLLPAGPLREPMSSLRRADLIVVTKGTGWDEQEAGMAELRKRFRSKEVTAVRFRPAALIDGVSGERVSADRVSPRRIVAVSGIADPAAFEMSLREMGFDVAGHVARPDHAWYRQEDWEEAVRLCRATGSDAVVTTEKDLVRLREIGSVCDPPAEYPRLFAAELEAVWQGEDPLAGLLARVRRLVEDARRQSRDGEGRT